MMRKKKKGTETMARKLIIDGNAVYEIDEECMLKRRVDKEKSDQDRHFGKTKQRDEQKNSEGKNR